MIENLTDNDEGVVNARFPIDSIGLVPTHAKAHENVPKLNRTPG